MKKYMTVAALLIAGAAFANATEEAFNFNGETSVSLSNTFDLTKDWSFNFSLQGPAYDFSTGPAAATLLSSGAFSLESNTAGAFVFSAGSVSKTFTDDAWQWAGMMSQSTAFTIDYTANTGTVTAKIEVGGSGTLTTESLTGVSYAGQTLSSITTTVPSGVTGWSQPTGTITGTAIPEPSAFGLLAGIGALALVASRRRRK